jgi:plastocyanin
MQKTSQNNVLRAGLALVAAFGMALGMAGSASAEPAAFVLTIKDHKFDPAELKIPADKAATLVVKNLDATPEEFESKPLRIEKVVPANSEASFQLRALKPGRYKFFGEFHEDSAKGELVVE